MKKLSFLILLSPVFILLACDDDDVEIRQDPIVFYDDAGYFFQATCVGDDIEFFLDITPDTTDNRSGSSFDGDFYGLYIDYNNNQVLDPNIDLLMGTTEDGRICIAKLLSETSTTGCSFSDDYSGMTLFSSTENSEVPHINHLVRVPKSILSADSSIGVIVRLNDGAGGQRWLPEGFDFFGKTLSIRW